MSPLPPQPVLHSPFDPLYDVKSLALHNQPGANPWPAKPPAKADQMAPGPPSP